MQKKVEWGKTTHIRLPDLVLPNWWWKKLFEHLFVFMLDGPKTPLKPDIIALESRVMATDGVKLHDQRIFQTPLCQTPRNFEI